MSERISFLVDQMKRGFEGEAWHGPALMEVLAGVTAEQAAHRPFPAAHSIWEIVRHLITWKTVIPRRLRGELVNVPDEQDWPAADHTEAAWQKTLQELHAAQRGLLIAIEQLKDDDLRRDVPGKPYNAEFMLEGCLQHDLYHTGQIAVLKKGVAAPTRAA